MKMKMKGVEAEVEREKNCKRWELIFLVLVWLRLGLVIFIETLKGGWVFVLNIPTRKYSFYTRRIC